MQAAVDSLVFFLNMFRAPGPRPILWVGAGASAAAGRPTLGQLDAHLRSRIPPSASTGFALVDEFVAEYGTAPVESALQTLLGPPRPFAELHTAMAHLAGAGVFDAVFTANYDELIERALEASGVRFVPQVLALNYRLRAGAELSVLKLHGSRTDWASVLLSGESHRRFHGASPLLHNQLDLNMRLRPLLFVGCSMQDPRLLDWLLTLPDPERRDLFPARVLITDSDWSKVPRTDQTLLSAANVKPVRVATHADVAATLAGVAAKLAP
jgi:SIR2-like domain